MAAAGGGFYGDYAVNELDLAELAAYWLSSDA
jgi:hypothetical protein